MELTTLIQKNRSYRRFDQSRHLTEQELHRLIELARLAPSPKNMQPLRYLPVFEKEDKDSLFECLKWAGYLKDWPGPVEGERPGGYLVVMGDRELSRSFHYDVGFSGQNILLGAVEMDLGGCVVAAFNRKKVRKLFDLPSQFNLLVVIALGKPIEEIQIEPFEEKPNYWRDEKGIHHVPKRSLEDLLFAQKDREKAP